MLNEAGEEPIIQEGESANLVLTPKDMDQNAISKANLIELIATMYDQGSGTSVNGLNQSNVFDDQDGVGTVADDGTLTIRLNGPEIAGVVQPMEVQVQIFRLEWTWNDGVSERRGIKEWRVRIQKLQSVT